MLVESARCSATLFLLSGATSLVALLADRLVLCERHALEVKLEGQIEWWGEMLFHIELWSKEARRRERPDVVGLLEDQRIEATSARQRAYEECDNICLPRPAPVPC